jgi:inward rectifier potassium channel
MWRFMLIIIYAGINFIFATIYYGIGIEIASTDSEWVKFGQAYFFSAQTFTTVGYDISPVGFLTSALSAAEALLVY